MNNSVYSNGVYSSSELKETSFSWRLEEMIGLGNNYYIKAFYLSRENYELVADDVNNSRNGKLIDLRQENSFLPANLDSNYRAFLIMINSVKQDCDDGLLDLAFRFNSKKANSIVRYEYNYIEIRNLSGGRTSSTYPEFPVDDYKQKLEPRASNFTVKKSFSRRYLIIFKKEDIVLKNKNILSITNKNERSINYEYIE